MADNFGLKIGVEGEKQFKAALADMNRQFRVLGSEMKLATSQFDKNERSVESLTAKNEVLAKQIEAQKSKIETLRSALENASTSFGENDKRTQQWVVALNNAEAELNGMERELKSNEQAIDSVGGEMGDASKQTDKLGDEIADTAKEADNAGGKFDKLGGVLKGMGAALAAGVAAIGAAAIGAGKALVDMTVSAAAYADEMLTQSTVTGMSVERLQAYAYAADLVDVSMEALTGSMAKNVKSMANAQQGSARYADAYKALGVAVTNADGSLRDSETVYWEAIDALGKVANETQRDALSMQLFGKSAQELNPLIAQGSAGIAALTDEAKRMGAVLSEDAIAKLGAFDDSVQRLKQGGEAAKRVLGTIGSVTVTGTIHRSSVDYLSAWQIISTRLLDELGGYLFIRFDNSENCILDYLGDVPDTSTQRIEFGENLIDLAISRSAADTYTACIPLGATMREIDPENDSDERLTIASVNDGLDYFAEGTHVAIIEQPTFDRAQQILSERREQNKASKPSTARYPFSGLITCGICGGKFRHRTCNGKLYWQCETFLYQGKSVCPAKQIPEATLYEITATALGSFVFDEAELKQRVKRIVVIGPNSLRYEFFDGSFSEIAWKDRSRSESWTPEMRQKAAAQMRRRYVK